MRNSDKNMVSKPKTTAKPGRPPEVRPEIIVQYQERDYGQKEIVEAVKAALSNKGWTGRIKSMTLYVKPEDIKKFVRWWKWKRELKRMDFWWSFYGMSSWSFFPPSFYYTHTEEEIHFETKKLCVSLNKLIDSFLNEPTNADKDISGAF